MPFLPVAFITCFEVSSYLEGSYILSSALLHLIHCHWQPGSSKNIFPLTDIRIQHSTVISAAVVSRTPLGVFIPGNFSHHSGREKMFLHLDLFRVHWNRRDCARESKPADTLWWITLTFKMVKGWLREMTWEQSNKDIKLQYLRESHTSFVHVSSVLGLLGTSIQALHLNLP